MIMSFYKQIAFGLFLTLSCSGQQKVTDEESIRRSVETFFTWYIRTTRDSRYSAYVQGAPGEGGNTKLETTEYFKRLDSLGIVGEDFIRSEKERFRPCDSLLRTVPWTTFSKADAYEYDSKCDWLYYYYWTSSQEPHDGVEVLDINVDKDSATAIANIYYGSERASGDKVRVFLTETKGRWLITRMEKQQ